MFINTMLRYGAFTGLPLNILATCLITFGCLILLSGFDVRSTDSLFQRTWLLFVFIGPLLGPGLWLQALFYSGQFKSSTCSSGFVVAIIIWVGAFASIPYLRPFVLAHLAG